MLGSRTWVAHDGLPASHQQRSSLSRLCPTYFCGRRPLPFGGSHLRLPSGPAGIRSTTGSLSALARPTPYQLSHRVACRLCPTYKSIKINQDNWTNMGVRNGRVGADSTVQETNWDAQREKAWVNAYDHASASQICLQNICWQQQNFPMAGPTFGSKSGPQNGAQAKT